MPVPEREKGQGGFVGNNVMGAYGRDVQNGSDGLFLRFADNHKSVINNTCFSTPTGSQYHTFEGAQGPSQRYRLDYMHTRQCNRRLVRIVTERRILPSESDHDITSVVTRLIGTFAPHGRKRASLAGVGRINRQLTTSNPDL